MESLRIFGLLCVSFWTVLQVSHVNGECDLGYYGFRCDGRCYCANATEHPEPCMSSGYCLYGCQQGYVGNNCNKDGTPVIKLFTYEEKMNSNTTTTLSCTAMGNPVPEGGSVRVYDSNSTAVRKKSASVIRRLYKMEVYYRVVVVEPGENFTCVLELPDGTTTEEQFFVDVFTPPSLTSAPTINQSSITSSSILISWLPWDSSMPGEGPITEYLINYQRTTTPFESWGDSIRVPGNESTVNVTDLYWDTGYEFSVVAIRPGEGGEGSPSQSVQGTTKCDVPTEAATITEVRAMNSSALLIYWQLPPRMTWQCKTLQDVKVTWKKSTDDIYPQENTQLVTNTTSANTMITELKSCVTYDVRVQLRNSVLLVGPVSESMNGTTLTSDIVVDAVNTSSISLRWKMPECALPITKELLFRYYQPENQTRSDSVEIPSTPGTVDYLEIHHLQADQRYLIIMQILKTDGNMLEIGDVEISTLRDACYAEKRTLSWPKTLPGDSTDSIEKCPQYSAKAGIPRGSRICELGLDLQPIWNDPIIIDCFQDDKMTIPDQLDMISKNPVHTNNVEEVAGDVAYLSGNMDMIDMDGLEAIAKTLENIANVKDPSPEVTTSVVTTIDNILDIDNEQFVDAMLTNSPTRILKSLETQISNQQKQGGNFSHTGRNIAVTAFDVDEDLLTSGLGYAQKTNDLDTEEDRVSGRVYFNTSHIDVEETDVAIILPEMGFKMKGTNASADDVPVNFIIYKNSKLFQSNRLLTGGSCSDRTQPVVGTQIVAASIEGMKIANLPADHPVINVFQTLEVWDSGTLDNFECVYWDYTFEDGHGDWSNEGCYIAVNITTNRTVCYCDHLTSFAVIMDFRGQAKTSLVLTLISTIGCGISIATLSITIITYLSIKSLRNNPPSRILICLSTSLFCLYIIFLIGIDQTQSFGGCVTVAVLLHYFTLSSVCWMVIEAVNMYLMVVKVFNIHVKKFLLKAALFAWGSPAVLVGLVLAIDYLQYCNQQHCFMQVGYAFYFADLLPIFIMLSFNICIFVLVIQKLTCRRTLIKKPAQRTPNTAKERQQTINRALNALAITGLLGLTWIFGFFTVINTANIAFQVIFTVCNSFQGFLIFLLFCVRQKDVRQAWKRCFTSKKQDFVSNRVEMSNASRFNAYNHNNIAR